MTGRTKAGVWTRARSGALGVLLIGHALPAQSVGPATQVPRRDSTAVEREIGAAYAVERAGRIADAEAQYRRVAQTARARGDREGEAVAEYRLGIAFWSQSRHDSALVHLTAARDLRRTLPDRVEYARVLNGLGATYYQRGVYEPALDAFREAEGLRRQLHDSIGLARTLTNIGKTYHDWGQLDRGREKLRDAIAVAARAHLGAPALGYAWNSLALLAIDAGEYDSAGVYIQRSLQAYAGPSAVVSAADSADVWEINAGARGKLLVRQGNLAAAIPVLDSVIARAAQRRSVRGRADALVLKGEALLARGETAAARLVFREALMVAQGGGQRVLALQALQHLARAEEREGDVAMALALLKRAEALRDTVFSQDVAQRIAAREARAEADAARADNALLLEAQQAQAVTISRQRIAVGLSIVILLVVSTLIALLARARSAERARSADLLAANTDLERLNGELRAAMAQVRTLSGLIPICANCKRVRDDRGYWQAVDTWVSQHSDATFSHSICQSCGPVLYGELWTLGDSDDGSTPASTAPAPTRGTAE